MNKKARYTFIILIFLFFSSLFYAAKLRIDKHLVSEELELAINASFVLIGEKENLIKKSKADDLLISGEFNRAFELYHQLVNEKGFGDILQLREKYTSEQKNLINSSNGNSNAISIDTSTQVALKNEIEILKTKQSLAIDSLKNELEQRMFALRQKLNDKAVLKELSFYSIQGTKTVYFGEVINNKSNGKGVGYYRSGNIYIGNWKNNLREDKSGTYYFLNGDRYVGNYSKDRREGKGTYYWASGDRYEGEWKNDMRNGFGSLYGNDNKLKIEGMWKNDELIEPKE